MSTFEHHISRAHAHLADEHDDQARIIELAKLRDDARAREDEVTVAMYQRRIDQARDRRRVALKRAEVQSLLAIAYALRGDPTPMISLAPPEPFPTPQDVLDGLRSGGPTRTFTYPEGPSYRKDQQ